jgi:hypothetical protein
MTGIARDRLRFALAAVGAVLVAAPGVHLFERWLAPAPATWVSHSLAVALLAVVAWRWLRWRRSAA